MVKIIEKFERMINLKKYLKLIIILTILLVLYLYVANITLMPKSITLLQGEKLELATLWGVNLKETQISNRNININKQNSILETSGDIENNENLEVGKNRYECQFI